MKLTETAVRIREEGGTLRKEKRSFPKGLTLEGRGTSFCLLRYAAVAMLCLVLIAPTSLCLADDVPVHVITVIKQKAAREFPNDKNLQQLTIERQKNAYRAVRQYSDKKIPGNILARIKKRAVFECPGDYCGQQYLIESQSRDYLYLKDYLPEGVSHQAFIKIMRSAELEFPDDFSTQRLIVDAKVKKYRDLEKVSCLEVETGEIGQSDSEKETAPAAATPLVIHEEEQTVEEIREDVKETAEKRYHVISKGENLYRISLRYGLTVSELCHINGITPQDVIKPGQKLLVTP